MGSRKVYHPILCTYLVISVTGIVACCVATFFVSWQLDQQSLSLVQQPDDSAFSKILRNKVSVGLKQERVGSLVRGYNSSAHRRAFADDWKRRPVAIFYNIYIPPPTSGQRHVEQALDIVQEQLQQIGASPVTHEPVTLFYNLLGYATPLSHSKMTAWCDHASPHLQCERLGVHSTGTERLTLHDLWSFCRDASHHDYRVTYLHSKGSFHPSDKNTYWRRLLTAAAVDPDCIQPPDSTCNLCGLQFFTQFTMFVPGNMFTASCSYVEQLLPPLAETYEMRHETWVRESLLLRLRNQFRFSLLWDRLDYWGLDRYADEHWIGSHPAVIPCDMDPFSDIANVFNGSLALEEFSWSMGPRTKGVVGGINDELQDPVRSNPSLRQREILLLPGYILKWHTLYEVVPAHNSWVWQFFPDGTMWWDAIQEHGGALDAIQSLTETYRSSADGSFLKSSFASPPLPPSELQIDNSFAVFYHVVVRPDECSSLGNKLSLVQQQLEIVSESTNETETTPLILSVAYDCQGENTQDQTTTDMRAQLLDLCKMFPHFNCMSGRELIHNHEGETLSLLHDHCFKNPTAHVAYLHTEAPMQHRMATENEKLILVLTTAALHPKCFRAMPAMCSVCGLSFQVIWLFSFLGNMFSASCHYVNRLVPPREYEQRRTEFVGKLLLRRLRQQSITSLFPDRPEYFGLDRYSTEAWIGSHPSIQPCELSTSSWSMGSWTGINLTETVANFSLSLPQLRYPDEADSESLKKTLASDSLRLREYFLLPGLMLRWSFLYKELPKFDSWIWWSIPDGTTILRAVHHYGLAAADHVAAPFFTTDVF